MTIDDIQKLIDQDESVTLELKKGTGELKDAMHTACAFLNTDGGWLIFGVTPTSRRILQRWEEIDSHLFRCLRLGS